MVLSLVIQIRGVKGGEYKSVNGLYKSLIESYESGWSRTKDVRTMGCK